VGVPARQAVLFSNETKENKMPRILSVDRIDNGFIVQTVATGNLEGIRIATDEVEVLRMVAGAMGVEMNRVPASSPSPKAPLHIVNTPEPAADPVFNPRKECRTIGGMEAELERIFNENDRDAAHKWLKSLMEEGAISGYNLRLGVPKLVCIIRDAEARKAESLGAEDAPIKLPEKGSPAEPDVPGDFFAPEPPAITLAELGDALREAAKRTSPGEAFAILKARKVRRLSELKPEEYRRVLAEANNLGA
jgi:hypothetical protein